MTGRIMLTPDELRASAQKYAEGSQRIEEILGNLTTEQAVIGESWEGDAFDSFDDQFAELSPRIRQFAELLQDVHDQLDRVAEIVERTDADIASQIRG